MVDSTKLNSLVQLIDVIDSNSKLISEVSGIAKNILSKDPKALDGTALEYIIKNHFGESMYERIHKIYTEIIGT